MSKEKVLIVDDEKTLVKALKFNLRKASGWKRPMTAKRP